MVYAKITGIASYLPDDILDNEMLSKMVDTNDEWITTRVGIKERRILRKDVGSSYMGAEAIKRLLAKTGTAPEEVELIICATSNPDYRFPSTASVIAGLTGATAGYGYDIQAACAGFIVALQDAKGYILSGLYKKVVVVCTEKMSSMINYEDRSTCALFGDAVLHVNPEGMPHLVMPAGGSALPTTIETVKAGQNFLFQDGRHVYKHAVTDMLSSTLTIMERNSLTVDTVDWLVPHQANLRIIEAVASRAKMPMEKVLVNIEKRGNTSAASIPICLDENTDRLKAGDRVVLTAFGAGYTWGAMYLIW